jgi:hypothetical protein
MHMEKHAHHLEPEQKNRSSLCTESNPWVTKAVPRVNYVPGETCKPRVTYVQKVTYLPEVTNIQRVTYVPGINFVPEVTFAQGVCTYVPMYNEVRFNESKKCLNQNG